MERMIPTNNLMKVFDLPDNIEDENQVSEEYARGWGLNYVIQSTKSSIEVLKNTEYDPNIIDSLLYSWYAYNRRLEHLQGILKTKISKGEPPIL